MTWVKWQDILIGYSSTISVMLGTASLLKKLTSEETTSGVVQLCKMNQTRLRLWLATRLGKTRCVHSKKKLRESHTIKPLSTKLVRSTWLNFSLSVFASLCGTCSRNQEGLLHQISSLLVLHVLDLRITNVFFMPTSILNCSVLFCWVVVYTKCSCPVIVT